MSKEDQGERLGNGHQPLNKGHQPVAITQPRNDQAGHQPTSQGGAGPGKPPSQAGSSSKK